MLKALKIGGAIVFMLVILLLAVFVVAVYIVDDRFYLEIVQEAVRDSTGHSLEIGGRFEVERSLRPGLVADDVRLSNEAVAPPAEIANVKHLHFHIELLPLLTGDLRFAVVMEQPQIRLVVDAAGRRNWQLAEVRQAPRGDLSNDGGFELDIDRVEIVDGQVAYHDARNDSNVDVKIKSFELLHDREQLVATLGFFGSYRGTDYSVHGTLRDPAAHTPLHAELTVDAHTAGAGRDADPLLHVNASGTVSRLNQDPAFDLAVDGRIQNLLPFSEMLRVDAGEWTPLTPINATAQVQLQRGAVHVKDLDAMWTADGLSLAAKGTVSDWGGGNDLDLKLSATAETLSKLSQVPALSNISFPEIGPVTARGRWRGSRGSYRIDDLHTSVDTEHLALTAAGTVTELGDQPQGRLDVTTRIRDLSRVPAMFGLETDLPALGPIHANGVVERIQGAYQIQRITANWEQPGVRASLTGNATNLLETPAAAIQVDLQADSLDALSEFIEQELPAVGPVALQSKLALDSDRVHVNELEVRLGGSDLSGQIALSHKQIPPRLSAKLSSRRLDLDQLLDVPAHANVEGTETKDKQEKLDPATPEASDRARSDAAEQPWLPTEPLDLSWLDAWHGLVDARVEKMIQDGDSFEDIVVQVQLEPGILYIPVTRMKLDDGELSLNVGIDANQSPPSLYYRNVVKDIEIHSLLNVPEGVVTGGKTSGTVELFSTGSSPAEIMSNLKGNVRLHMGKARIVEAGLASVSSDLIGGMLRGVSQTKDEQPYTEYQCGVFGVEFRDGIATMDRSFALQSERFNVGGSGQVDLNKGTIHLQLRPRARKGLGISASMLTGGFKISGKLGTAQAGLSMKGLLESYLLSSTAALLVATPAGSVATGAVLALRGVWDRITAGTFSCKNTLKRIERRDLQ